MPLTLNDVYRLRDLCNAATPPPWIHFADDPEPDGCIESEDGGAIFCIAHHANTHTVLSTGEDFRHADAMLIVMMRNALPELLEMAEYYLEGW